jgi:hypothetical protein
MVKICGVFLAIRPDLDNIRKVSCDLADRGRYAETFCISTLTGAICGNYLSNKIVSLPSFWVNLSKASVTVPCPKIFSEEEFRI